MIEIRHMWDGKQLPLTFYIKLDFKNANDCVVIVIEAPFYNQPTCPKGDTGESVPELWNYEVVEVFFLNEKNQYLEVELCPHGQHLVLLLSGFREIFKDQLPIKFSSRIEGDRWFGEAHVPAEYFPPNVTRFNAYAIHGDEPQRVYKALFPTPEGKYDSPDFHRLKYFRPLDRSLLHPENHSLKYHSPFWQK